MRRRPMLALSLLLPVLGSASGANARVVDDPPPAGGQAIGVSTPDRVSTSREQSPLVVNANGRKSASSGGSTGVAQKLITLNTENTDIGAVLRMVARQSGLNVVIGPNVSGEVSAYLKDVPVSVALKAIAVNNGFDFTIEDDVITAPKPPDAAANGGEREEVVPQLETRVFALQWSDAARVREALEFALSKNGKIRVFNENSDGVYGATKFSQLS